jgi:hypothetical protein
MTLTRLIYFSESKIDAANGQILHSLNNILDAANRNNQAQGITGALVFDIRWFVQLLEGPRDSVWSAFVKIERDPRHTNVQFVEMAAVPTRRFGDWWMGCTQRVDDLDAVFAPYLFDGQFRPDCMGATMLHSLMLDLSAGCLIRSFAT